MNLCCRILAGLFLMLLPVACDTLDGGRSVTASTGSAYVPTAVPEARLGPGDKVRITIFGEDRLSGEYQIDATGSLSLPLAGSFQAAGLTKSELERLITRKFPSDILKNPRVLVDVTSFRPFYIMGEVNNPGEHQMRIGLNVVTAVALAGGHTYRASKSRIMIQRGGTGPMEEHPFDTSVSVMPGDLLRVPERYF
ncbi:MAG TPA: polysaccharide biosynthesis/export family protein [Microvirga sp.]|jgi:polysaccharide export outer membrane protein|nr:polysaccharide biosynthesis/export family protein [Microvirga sp.]